MVAAQTDSTPTSQPRFVILYHSVTGADIAQQTDAGEPRLDRRAALRQQSSHWDLMLQDGTVLRTWSLPDSEYAEGPFATSRQLVGDRLADHRVAYLDFEGAISAGRGRVRRWDSGPIEWTTLTENECIVQLFGIRLSGSLQLRRNSADPFWLVSLD